MDRDAEADSSWGLAAVEVFGPGFWKLDNSFILTMGCGLDLWRVGLEQNTEMLAKANPTIEYYDVLKYFFEEVRILFKSRLFFHHIL